MERQNQKTVASQVEGILLNKINFKDKDLIAHILTRDGQKISVCFYGVRGRGKKSSFSVVEIGHMIKVTLRNSSKKNNDLRVAKEWDIIWRHSKISENYQAYCYLCILLEIASKVVPSTSLEDEVGGSEGFFSALSNAVFYLDSSEVIDESHLASHFFFFISRFLLTLGIFPELCSCIQCDIPLDGQNVSELIDSDGGFLCATCSVNGNLDSKVIWRGLAKVKQLKFSEYYSLQLSEFSLAKRLLSYQCVHTDRNILSFNSLAHLTGTR